MMKRNRFIAFFLAFLAIAPAVARDVLPVTGSWINLFYQDERNKYSNPMDMDNTDPVMWRAKVREMKALGIEYIVFIRGVKQEIIIANIAATISTGTEKTLVIAIALIFSP